jgi:hypothetical protein
MMDREIPLWAGVLALLAVATLVDWALARRDTRRRQALSLTWDRPASPSRPHPTITPWVIWHPWFDGNYSELGVRVFAKDDRTAADILVGSQTVEENVA